MSTPMDYASIAELHRLGYTANQIAVRVGCSTRTVERWRRSQGLTERPAHASYPATPERLEAARSMLADGASHKDICLTLRMNRETLRRHFPGTAWTPSQSGHLAQMVRQLNQLESWQMAIRTVKEQEQDA